MFFLNKFLTNRSAYLIQIVWNCIARVREEKETCFKNEMDNNNNDDNNYVGLVVVFGKEK